ncbi:glycosyltransferase family 2 protein [Patescibacteria group bacterium]|nr:glycosyltransferase family 2 protein [Patescibacteria group bacterium]
MSSPLLIFVPAKNEAATIQIILRALRERFQDLPQPPDLLVIDDGSSDETSSLTQQEGAIVIRHECSQGLGRTFREAQQYALTHHYATLLTIDGDRQFREEDLRTIYNKLTKEGYDFVSGSRFLPESQTINMPHSKKIGNHGLARLVASITKRPITDSTCGLRGYSRQALESLHTFSTFTYTHEVILNLGMKPLRFAEVPIVVRYFPERVSRIAASLFRYGIKTIVILLQSLLLYQPARFFTALAVPFFVSGVPSALFVGARYLITGFVSPYKSIGIFGLIMTTAGIIIATSGALLQMLAWTQITIEQILFEQRRRPPSSHAKPD